MKFISMLSVAAAVAVALVQAEPQAQEHLFIQNKNSNKNSLETSSPHATATPSESNFLNFKSPEPSLFDSVLDEPRVTEPAVYEGTATIHIDKRVVTITAKSSSSDSGGDSSGVPALSTASSVTDAASSDEAMPTLSQDEPFSSTSSLPTPTVIVPSMAKNPYIRTSHLPEGTVFICVGAILGGILAAVVIWRVAAGIALQRSIKRAEKADIIANGEHKSLLPPSNQSIFGLGSNASTLNMSTTDLNPKSEKRDRVRKRMSGIPSQGGLFFSPTADVLLNAQQAASGAASSLSSATLGGATASAASQSVYNGTTGNGTATPSLHNNTRSSVYLPAGYYGPGNNGNNAASRISRTYSPASHRQHMPVANGRLGTMESNQQRAPSAYLDDLLAHSDSD